MTIFRVVFNVLWIFLSFFLSPPPPFFLPVTPSCKLDMICSSVWLKRKQKNKRSRRTPRAWQKKATSLQRKWRGRMKPWRMWRSKIAKGPTHLTSGFFPPCVFWDASWVHCTIAGIFFFCWFISWFLVLDLCIVTTFFFFFKLWEYKNSAFPKIVTLVYSGFMFLSLVKHCVVSLQESWQVDQVHWGPEREVHTVGPTGRGGAREAQAHKEQDQETS